MPTCPIGAMYNGVTHADKAEQAVVYKLETNNKQEITAALFKDTQGNEHRATGRYFVLAANGIEIPKLMLISTDARNPNGVGNSSGMVGRNLMDHPGVGVTFLANETLWPGRGPQEMTSMVGFRDGAFRSEYAAKKIHQSNMSRTDQIAAQLLKRDGVQLGRQLEAEIRDRAARFVEFDSFHEILPQPENRIVPSATQKDAMGIPKPEFHYAIDDYVRKSARHTKEGENLYPAMPYTSYTLITDEDAKLIKAYLFSLPPVKQKNRETELSFPFNERLELSAWR